MLTLPRRPNRPRIAVGSSARLSQLHLGSSQLGLNALQCDASDGVICGRAALQRRLRGQSRKLSLPVMSRTEAASIEIGGGLAQFGGAAADPGSDDDQDGPARFTIGSPLHFRRRTQPSVSPSPAPAPAGGGDSPPAAAAGAEGGTAPAAEGAEGGTSAEDAEDGASAEDTECGATTGEEPEAEAAPDTDPDLKKRVFAGNLPFTASKSRLWDLFEQFGKVANVHIVKAPHSGKSRGFGFVTFREEAGAQNALAADGSQALHLLRRQIRVSPAEPRAPSARSRAGRGAAAGGARRPPPPSGPCLVDRLPAELLQLVLSYLPLQQLLAVQRVSHRWQDAARDLLRRRQQLDLRAEPLLATATTGDFTLGRLTDRTLRYLLRLMPALRVLRTGGNVRTCSYKALDIVASHCKNLVEIDLDGFCINEDSLKKLCISCPSLEEVKLPNHYHFSEASVWVLLRHLPLLRTLELNSSDRVTGRCFSLLPAALRRLSVAGCTGLRADSLRQVGSRCPELRQLDVSSLPEGAAADLSAALAGCSQLERLTARRMMEPIERHVPAAGLPALRHLDLGSAVGVTDNTLRQLADLLPGLTTLNIQDCPSVTEDGLFHLRRCKHLLSLDLSYLRCVTDAVLDRLHGLPLKQLHLAEGYQGAAGFTDQGVTRLVVACQSLTLLDISCVEDLSPDLVDLLFEQLPVARDVTLYVGGTNLEELPPRLPGPLTLRDVNTVPPHMRGIIDELHLFGPDDFDEYDFDYDYDGIDDIDQDDFDDFHEYYYDYGYDDFDMDEDGHLIIL
ncbi:uncharacterized protein LOC122369615 isoform X2 [Amphibalanus amphitrite]|uniref:uncharacterized protein LOC122369615 isoform X1 n=1 Tax=Amphibalanus amphitrite TaxID=1232801 RepID=UPI001C8FCA95|nr:uncharacterized protein LOC122369615 isoform X1 [Amphibalanus amphitrite]XP_043200421.1 uncharacterized protein LOC122369615 isoform X1 [Amphibalanus amphitrite]XP_043200422.1 uncharacterized protein LOC122369615 isoform X2 [Amphibalanus amphitrite]